MIRDFASGVYARKGERDEPFPELLADAKRRRIDIEYTSGEELDRLAKEVITKDTEVIERMKKLLGK